jgi:hypothetical protein
MVILDWHFWMMIMFAVGFMYACYAVEKMNGYLEAADEEKKLLADEIAYLHKQLELSKGE